MAGTMNHVAIQYTATGVSMESGLDGRNNQNVQIQHTAAVRGLNGVRPRWPEQSRFSSLLEPQNLLSQWSPA